MSKTYLKCFFSQVPLCARPQEVHAVTIKSTLCAIGRKKDLFGWLLLLVLFLHDCNVSLSSSTPVIQFIILLILGLLRLKVEEDLPGIVALVEEVQVIQHSGVIEHVVHDLVPQQAAKLPDQLEGELMGRVNFSPPRLKINKIDIKDLLSTKSNSTFLSASSLFLASSSPFMALS